MQVSGGEKEGESGQMWERGCANGSVRIGSRDRVLGMREGVLGMRGAGSRTGERPWARVVNALGDNDP